MNIKEYISSGILEDYVMGLVSEQDAREVERMAELHPEIREEIKTIQTALENYAGKYKIAPSPSLKKKIWAGIQKQENNITKEPISKVVNINQNSQKYGYKKWLVAASVTLLIGSSILNITLFNKWKSAQKELTAINSEKEYYVQQYQIQKTALEKTKNEFTFLVQPSTKTIILKGVDKFPDALATAYWNSNTHEVYLAVNNLPIPPSDKQYQLWAIVDGKPVDAGVFDAGQGIEVIHKMKNFETAQAFAVTLEKKGGSPSPTLEAMYVIGKV